MRICRANTHHVSQRENIFARHCEERQRRGVLASRLPQTRQALATTNAGIAASTLPIRSDKKEPPALQGVFSSVNTNGIDRVIFED